MQLDLTKTLAELIAIPSVNPMGRDVEGEEFFEYRVTDYLENLFERMGVAWQRQAVEPKRENILARLDGRTPPERGGAVLLFEAHQDTVPVDGMTIEPWTPTIKDGRIYGRGSCDIKGGMVAMLGALARLADDRPPDMPTIIMACTVNEEHGYTGATALTKLWTAPGDSIMPPAGCGGGHRAHWAGHCRGPQRRGPLANAIPTAGPRTARSRSRVRMRFIKWPKC